MPQEIMMTESGLKALKDELEYLKVTGRQEIKEKIQVALSFGDLSENAEYDEARNDQGKLEARISELEELIANAKLIDEGSLSADVISIGSKVSIKLLDENGKGGNQIFEYHLVNSNSTLSKQDSDTAIASDDSPVAKALIGHKVGDIVSVEAPRGTIKYEVIFIY
ncbi:MAG: transcription elongation factor GreA [Acutalibacteraceae bacterium]